MIDKLSTELKQSVPHYVIPLRTNGVIIDVNCNYLANLKIVLLLSCLNESFFVLILNFFFVEFYYAFFPRILELS